MSNKVSNKTANVVTIEDVKGIELSSSELVSLTAKVSELEMELNAAIYAAHKSGIDNIISVADAVLKLRAVVDANLVNLGNYSSFKAWIGDRKFGIREIGYKQMSLYATIGKHADIARRLYNEEQVYALSELAKRINEETGNTKTGGRKVSEATAADVETAEVEIEDAEVLEVTNVTSLAAVLAFIESADAEQIAAIKAALKAKK
jgi:hypothetical protein